MMKPSCGRKVLSALGFALLLMAVPDVAHATTSTIGGVLYGTSTDIVSPLSKIIVQVSFFAGLCLTAAGLYHLANHGDSRHPVTRNGALLRILCGGALASLPDVMGSGVATLWAGNYSYSHAMDSPGTVSNCVAETSSNSNALTCVAQNFGVNVVPVALDLIFIISYLSGLIYGAHCLYKMMVATNHGHKTETGKTLWGFFIATVLTFFPRLIEDIMGTLNFGESAVSDSNGSILSTSSVPSILAYSGDGSGTSVLTEFSSLLSWLFVACVLFGVISVLRGIIMLKHSLEGGGRNEGMTGGIVHIIGGACMTNAKAFVCLILSTFIGNGMGFC